jgi:chemotaxis protein methyltransferase CheR
MSASPALAEAQSDLEASFTDREFEFFAKLVYERSGIVLGAQKKSMMFSRLVRRVRDLGLRSFKAYGEHIRGPQGETEIGAFINAMTTNLTRFFREEHHFEFLEKTVVPASVQHARQAGNSRLRIWSAGCSSGEEPYSIAITLQRALPSLAAHDARILATDLDTNMVARGASGIYPKAAVAELPPIWRDGFFHAAPDAKDKVVVDAALRSLIAFKPLNLLGIWPMSGPFDAIFCRNVMIYFDGPTKARLINRLAEMLRPGGWLFIGHSETLLEHQAQLKLVGRTIYRRNT